ncbi:MAG: hypothetical protein IBJ11_08455 [Phycisphaerales bacterium]|nr:hypothetical protein [Phycisphaerales bacterium]
MPIRSIRSLLAAAFAGAALLAPAAARADDTPKVGYRLSQLADFTGSTSVATGINNQGDTVGNVTVRRADNSQVTWGFRRFSNGQVVILSIPGALGSSLADINNAGTAVGTVTTAAGVQPVVWTSTNQLINLPKLTRFTPSAINDNGDIVGTDGPLNPPLTTAGGVVQVYTGVVLRQGQPLNLGVPAGTAPGSIVNVFPTDINSNGFIVGFTSQLDGQTPSDTERAFTLGGGAFNIATRVKDGDDTRDVVSGRFTSLNDSNVAAGIFNTGAGGNRKSLAVSWRFTQPELPIKLADKGNGGAISSFFVNNAGVFAGTETAEAGDDSLPEPFRVRRVNGAPVVEPLFVSPAAANWEVLRVAGINDAGVVAATATIAGVYPSRAALLVDSANAPGAPETPGKPQPPTSTGVANGDEDKADDGTILRVLTSGNNTAARPIRFEVQGTRGAIIRIWANGTLIAQGPLGPNGIIVSNGRSPLPDNDYRILMSQEVRGVQSDPAQVYNTLTVDTIAPPQPASPPVLDPASDTGASNTDGITNATSLTFTGGGEPGLEVRLLANGKFLKHDKTVIGAGGTWSITVPAQKAGVLSYAYTQVDRAGNLSKASPGKRVEVLGAKPPAPAAPGLLRADILRTERGVPVTSNVRPTITGRFRAGTTIEVFAGGVSVGTAATDTRGNWSLVPSADLPLGDSAITATATDLAGNVSPQSRPLTVRVVTPGG